MITRFICLANSFKEGGKCLAGIELDTHNTPVLLNGRPKWIRPVCETKHGEIPSEITESFHLLDIIEIKITKILPLGYQSENVMFAESSLRIVGKFSRDQLASLCDNQSFIFGNRGKAVSRENIKNLSHSLMLVNLTHFELVKKIYEDRPDKPQLRLQFTYSGNRYDFPITDPNFIQHYFQDRNLLEKVSQIYVTLSLGIEWNEWNYKLIACILM